MAVLVQTGGKIKLTPPKYEQLINYTMLYDFGVENAELAGGWTIYRATVTKNANNIAIGSNGVLHTVNTIPFTQYKKMYAVGVASAASHVYLACATSDHATPLYSFFGTSKGLIGIDLATALDTYIAQISADSGYTGTVYNVFLVKPDDINTLCTKAGISSPTSLDTLLADTTSLTAIFNNENAVKYMVKQCTGDFMVGVLNSADAVALLKASPYLNTVIGNPHWAKFIMMIPTAKELLGFTMLYDEGDECEEVTGGWSASGFSYTGLKTTAATKNANNIYSLGAPNELNILGTTNLIELSEYTKVWQYGEAVGTDTNDNLVLSILNNKNMNSGIVYQLTSWDTEGEIAVKSLDIEGGNYYVVVYSAGDTNRSGKTYAVFATKTDNWQTWASLGGVTATDLSTLLADSTKMATLMSNEEACKYMVGCTGDLMVSICNSEIAMNALVSNIAYDYAFNHPVWYKFMTMCPVSLAAMDSVAVTVPTMTSNTTPSGVASFVGTVSEVITDAYKSFDKDTSDGGFANFSTSAGGVQYESAEKVDVYKVYYYMANPHGTSANFTWEIDLSEDGTNWETIYTESSQWSKGGYSEGTISTKIRAKYIRCLTTVKHSNANAVAKELNFYGKAVAK